MRNPNAAGPVLLLLGAAWALRYVAWLLAVPVICVVWWELGWPGLARVALIVFWSRLAVRSYRRLQEHR